MKKIFSSEGHSRRETHPLHNRSRFLQCELNCMFGRFEIGLRFRAVCVNSLLIILQAEQTL